MSNVDTNFKHEHRDIRLNWFERSYLIYLSSFVPVPRIPNKLTRRTTTSKAARLNVAACDSPARLPRSPATRASIHVACHPSSGPPVALRSSLRDATAPRTSKPWTRPSWASACSSRVPRASLERCARAERRKGEEIHRVTDSVGSLCLCLRCWWRSSCGAHPQSARCVFLRRLRHPWAARPHSAAAYAHTMQIILLIRPRKGVEPGVRLRKEVVDR
jgi:hypothetical protein